MKCSSYTADGLDVNKMHTAHQTGANTLKELFMSPWNAAIFVDGVYKCSGTLIDLQWVTTSRKCMEYI